LSQIVIEYDREAGLSTSIHFPSSESSVAIQLLPEGTNPQARIFHFARSLLADLRRPFTANLGGVLTMLTTTHPLLTLFDELEKLQTPSNAASSTASEKNTSSPSSSIRLHVIARSPTHFALQYFASPSNSRPMIARFEIFRHLRRDTPVWILRPALEETVSYSRSSFADNALKQRLIDDVFNIGGAPGWLGLDTGASCPIDSPGPLVRRVDEVVRTWAEESLKDVLADGQKQEQSGNTKTGERITEAEGPVNAPAKATQLQRPQQQQQQQPPRGGGSRPAINGANQGRPNINASRPPHQGQQRAKDVITLD
jgi:hypothetical protein